MQSITANYCCNIMKGKVKTNVYIVTDVLFQYYYLFKNPVTGFFNRLRNKKYAID